MKRFTLRLFLIRKLIESLMWSCIDEYTEFEEVADGLAKAHSAMDRKTRICPSEPEQVAACRYIIVSGGCTGDGVRCGNSTTESMVPMCPGPLSAHDNHAGCDGWACGRPVDSAKRWLAEHGIKE